MPTPASECLYCQNNETLHNLMIKIGDLEVSQSIILVQRAIVYRSLQRGL